jgi:hypothetical protein
MERYLKSGEPDARLTHDSRLTTEVIMPTSWTNKDERQYEHIKNSERKEGRSLKRSKEIAAATVNKRRGKEGRTAKSRRSK